MPRRGGSWGPPGEPSPRQQQAMKEGSGQGTVPCGPQGCSRWGRLPLPMGGDVPAPRWPCAGAPPSPLPACPSPRASESLPPRAGGWLAAGRKGQLPWKPAGKLGERLLAFERGSEAVQTGWSCSGRARGRGGTREMGEKRGAGSSRRCGWWRRGEDAEAEGSVARCPGWELQLHGHGPSTWAAWCVLPRAQQGPGGVPAVPRAGAHWGACAGPEQGVAAPHIPHPPHQGTHSPSIPARSRPSAPALHPPPRITLFLNSLTFNYYLPAA